MLFVGIAIANAQTSNGTVIGAVTDSTGSAIVGATVTITSLDNGAVRTTTTNQDGTYRIESVLAGVYNISASAPGFETTVNKGQQVPSSTIVTSSLVLRVGQTSDKVEVSADNAVLNTDNGQLSGTIGELEISSLPIATLNPYELALTLPGVMNTQVGGFSNGVDFNVGGGRPRANNFLIEGQDNNDAGIQGQGLQPGNDEAVKEVTILENAYTAEYGHGAGSVSNLIYKSGTNQWHGAVYERLQNSSLDTVDKNEHFNGITSNNKYRENQPGFRVGGPIIHNKVFAFASYQWDYFRSTANLASLTIPTSAGFATLGSYSSNPRVANLIKAYGGLQGTNGGTKTTPPAIALGPDPVTGADRGTVEMGTVERNLGADDNAPEIDLKGDYIPSDKDTLTLRFVRTRFTAPFDVFNFDSQLPGFDSDQDGTSYNTGIVETHVFSPNVVNEFRLSYGRIGFTFGLPASTLANPLYNQPAVTISNMTGYGIPGGIPQGRFHNTYQLQDTVSWIHGKHFFKFGEDIADIRVRDQVPFNFYGSIGFAKDTSSTTVAGQTVKYSGLANLIDDFGGPASTVTQQFGSPVAQPRLFSQNYFAQDTYRPIPTLSLDLGFRYEYNGAPFNAHGTPYPGIDESNPSCFPLNPGATCKTAQQADGSDWGPRAGIAWSPTLFGQQKTVVRSGFGVFYDVVFTNIIDNIQATAPNAASPVITSSTKANGNRGTSSWYEQFASLNKNPRATNSSDPIVNHLLSPRTLHWNLNVEQELPWATSFQVGYVGERGEHLYGNTNLNPFVNDNFSGTRTIPTRGSIVLRDNSDDSEYAGLWSELDHKFNHQFLFRASYTYGKNMDDGSEIFTPGGTNESSYQFSRYPTQRGTTDWGPSEYDHRQRLVLAYVWTPSVWHTEGGMKLVGNIVNHWALAGVTQFQSGSTHNVELGYDNDGDGIGNDRPILGNRKAPMDTYAFDASWLGETPGTLCSGPSVWNTNDDCHVVTPDQVHWIVGEFGTHPTNPVGRNSYYGPGYQQWDVNVQRSFKLGERFTLDFRGELFNLFNHGEVDTFIPQLNETFLENTTLVSGINTDQFNDNGTNTFASPYPATGGHRHARMYVRISF